jgi:LacI family transcriptional regulator
MADILDGAKAALDGTPYQLVVVPADGPEYGAIESLADGLVDGIVAISPLVEPAWLEELAGRMPIVMLGRHDQPEHYDTVVGDDEVGARLVLEHLLERGHRRIAHLTEAEPVTRPGSGTPHSVRLRVYREAMARPGLGSYAQVVRADHTGAGARGATNELMTGQNPPTAIMAGHDDLAIGALAALADLGYGLGEVAVAGYDNTDVAAHPLVSLTTVDQRGAEMGAQAVTFLLERIQGRVEPRCHVVTPTLVVRSSTAPQPT